MTAPGDNAAAVHYQHQNPDDSFGPRFMLWAAHQRGRFYAEAAGDRPMLLTAAVDAAFADWLAARCGCSQTPRAQRGGAPIPPG